jgi:hypothetical protein
METEMAASLADLLGAWKEIRKVFLLAAKKVALTAGVLVDARAVTMVFVKESVMVA